MRTFILSVAIVATTAVGVVWLGSPGIGAQSATPPAAATGIARDLLGQGGSAVAPDRILLLQRRTFAPGSDSGAHPAPGPTVLYDESGSVKFSVVQGAAIRWRDGKADGAPVAAGSSVDLAPGDAVFYDQGVVHDVANDGTTPGVTLEARFNPAPTATPAA
jgi:mannose-6-phosphate isomerase-like protein (cupin superfamily)